MMLPKPLPHTLMSVLEKLFRLSPPFVQHPLSSRGFSQRSPSDHSKAFQIKEENFQIFANEITKNGERELWTALVACSCSFGGCKFSTCSIQDWACCPCYILAFKPAIFLEHSSLCFMLSSVFTPPLSLRLNNLRLLLTLEFTGGMQVCKAFKTCDIKKRRHQQCP